MTKKYIGADVKCPLFLSDINETWVFSSLKKPGNIKFDENQFSVS